MFSTSIYTRQYFASRHTPWLASNTTYFAQWDTNSKIAQLQNALLIQVYTVICTSLRE